MTLRGEIDAFPLETVVQLVHSTGKTGQLEVRGVDFSGGTLGFDAGRLVAAISGDDVGEPALGAVFAVAVGSFEFIPWTDPPAANLSGDLDQVLDRAVAERDKIVAIRAIIPDERSRFRLSERAAEKGDVTLAPDQWRTLLAVNGERNVAQVADHLKAGRLAAMAALAALVEAGFVDVLAPDAAAPPPPAYVEPPQPAPTQTAQTVEPVQLPELAPEPPPQPEPEWTAPIQEWAPPPPVAPEPVPPQAAAPVWEPAPAPAPEPAPPAEAVPASRAWETALPAQDWEKPAPVAPQWSPAQTDDLRADLAAALDARMSAAPAIELEAPPAPIETPPADERLAALSGVFGPAPVAPEAPPPPAPAPAPQQERISEWSRMAAEVTAPEAPPEEKKKGRFGFLKREEPARDGSAAATATASAPAPVAGRAGQLASLANALLGEYNGGKYGKGRLDDRMANLLMRVDEQADPIDRPLPIVDDRIDSQALDRENMPEEQVVPYLALLCTQIFEDAERTFGKDKAKKGFKAAQQQVFGSDLSTLSAPDIAGRLPKV